MCVWEREEIVTWNNTQSQLFLITWYIQRLMTIIKSDIIIIEAAVAVSEVKWRRRRRSPWRMGEKKNDDDNQLSAKTSDRHLLLVGKLRRRRWERDTLETKRAREIEKLSTRRLRLYAHKRASHYTLSPVTTTAAAATVQPRQIIMLQRIAKRLNNSSVLSFSFSLIFFLFFREK